MTEFQRKEHRRRTRTGDEVVVSRAVVKRENWGKKSSNVVEITQTPFAQPESGQQANSSHDRFLEKHPEFKETWHLTARFVVPNAKCPVCGVSVFFYQNEHGSRVFFDELGPPWPKHACTDSPPSSAPFAEPQLGRTFRIRAQLAVSEIMKWQNDRGTDCESEFTIKYGASPWQLATVVQRMKSAKLVFVVAKLLKRGHATKVYFSCKSLSKCCKKGCLIALDKRKISFIHTATLEPVEVAIKRYRGAAPFLDAMDDINAAEK